MVRKLVKKLSACVLAAAVVAGLSGCGSVTSGKRIVRISHAQSETHPEHLGLLAFKEYVEERLGDKYQGAFNGKKSYDGRRSPPLPSEDQYGQWYQSGGDGTDGIVHDDGVSRTARK